MAWNFRKRIKIIPGVYLNLSKGGVSASVGVKGASMNIGKNGTYLNTGIPGTGIYGRQKIAGASKAIPIGAYNNTLETNDTIGDSDGFSAIDWSIQPKIKDGSIGTMLKGILIQIIPFGTLFVLFQGLQYRKKITTSIYQTLPIKVMDRRYKSNYRIEGYRVAKSGEWRPLSEEELTFSRRRGKYYLLSIPVFLMLAYYIYLSIG